MSDTTTTLTAEDRAALSDLLTVPPLFDEPMSQHTTMRTGGPADALVDPASVEEVRRVLQYCARRGLRIVPLGGGSNVIVSSAGLRAVVLRIGSHCAFCTVEESDVLLTSAGTALAVLVREAADNGLTGLEFGLGIPGTVGGALVGNSGAGESSVGGVLAEVTFVETSGDLATAPASRFRFGYRSSNVSDGGRILVGARFKLRSSSQEEVGQRMAAIAERRQRYQPLAEPSSGCVFRNLPNQSAGKLLDSLGAKGMRVGDAVVSERHANFILNRGAATGEDIRELVSRLQALAWEQASVVLEPEIKFLAPFDFTMEPGEDGRSL